MRLTQAMRDAFVIRVMNDVPQVKYREQVRQMIQADAKAKLPPVIRAMIGTPMESYVRMQSYHTTIEYVSVYSDGHYKMDTALKETVEQLYEKDAAQTEAYTNMKKDLSNAIRRITTTKALAEHFPDLAAYVPRDEAQSAAANRLLPAADYTTRLRNMGWMRPLQGAANV